MATKTKSRAKQKTAGELKISRTFNAPPEMLFRAWTKPNRVMRWWGPKSFIVPFCKIDLQVGGVFHLCMRSPDGRDYCSKGFYREISEPNKLVFTDSFVDDAGNPVPASYYGMSEDWPSEGLVEVAFEAQDSKTKMDLKYTGIPEGKDREMAEAGWNESFDTLEQLLAQSAL